MGGRTLPRIGQLIPRQALQRAAQAAGRGAMAMAAERTALGIGPHGKPHTLPHTERQQQGQAAGTAALHRRASATGERIALHATNGAQLIADERSGVGRRERKRITRVAAGALRRELQQHKRR